jgi:hypothetical protein
MVLAVFLQVWLRCPISEITRPVCTLYIALVTDILTGNPRKRIEPRRAASRQLTRHRYHTVLPDIFVAPLPTLFGICSESCVLRLFCPLEASGL